MRKLYGTRHIKNIKRGRDLWAMEGPRTAEQRALEKAADEILRQGKVTGNQGAKPKRSRR